MPTDPLAFPLLDNRTLGTVLAALRYWQREGMHAYRDETDIATDGGTIDPLSAAEIDVLCETINCDTRTALLIHGPAERESLARAISHEMSFALAEGKDDRHTIATGLLMRLQGNCTMKPPTIGIMLENGLVRDVFTTDPCLNGVRIVTIDYDTEGGDHDSMTPVRQSDGSEERAFVYVQTLDAGGVGVDLEQVIQRKEAGDTPQVED